MSDKGHLTTSLSHHRELHCGTDSEPTTPQGTGLRYWPQTITRTMLSIMQHGRRINKTQDQQYHTSMPWSNSRVLLQGCDNTEHTHSQIRVIFCTRCGPKWSRNGQAQFQRMPDDKRKAFILLFTLCHQYSVQSGPESCDNSLTSKLSESPSDIKQKSGGMQAVREKFYHDVTASL